MWVGPSHKASKATGLGCSELVELVGCEHLTLLKWLLVFGCPKLQLGEVVLSRWIKISWWRDYHFKWLYPVSRPHDSPMTSNNE